MNKPQHDLDILPAAGASPDAFVIDRVVRDRYSGASQAVAPELCCPVDYNPEYLRILPPELIERDYGCGDPSRHVRPGETVLDLGSGGGKICYIAAQVVGAGGQVIGVDTNDDMLDLARRYQRQIGEALGYHNTRFCKGRIQDLALDLDRFEAYLRERPVRGSSDWLLALEHADHLRQTEPMIADRSIDVIVSNCVLNLVGHDDRRRLFQEMFRVLRPHGRAVISDITCDEAPGEHLRRDPKLWSGCLSGAFVENEFLDAFTAAGFHGVRILERQVDPWATIEGIEFRSMTVEAFKRDEGGKFDHKQAILYRGPWKSVQTDDGQTFRRGVRTAVSAASFETHTRPPYKDEVFAIAPHDALAAGDAKSFDDSASQVRSPRETKGLAYDKTDLNSGDCCGPQGCC